MSAFLDLQKTRDLMRRDNVDVLVAASLEHVYYTSGFYARQLLTSRENIGTTFSVIPMDGALEPALIAGEPQAELAREQSWITDQRYIFPFFTWVDRPEQHRPRIAGRNALEVLAQVLVEKGLASGRVGIEENVFPVSRFRRLQSLLPRATFVDASGLLLDLRMIKSNQEIEFVKRATAVSERALEAAFEILREGVTEAEIVREYNAAVIREGGMLSYPAHMSLPCVGKESSQMYWAFPRDYPAKKGDMVKLDVGAAYRGYVADFCRSGTVGEPNSSQKRLYETILECVTQMLKSIKPNVKASDIFRIGYNVVKKQYPQFGRDCIGHGLGLSLHEKPDISPNSDIVLEPNMILCVEAPYYVYGQGGLNLEETVLVTRDGYEPITRMKPDLRVF